MPSPAPKDCKTHLYALGSNSAGQLGLHYEHNSGDPSTPHRCIFSAPPSSSQRGYIDYIPLHPHEHIKKITAGGNHALLLTTRGRVFSTGEWGADERGVVGWDHVIQEGEFVKAPGGGVGVGGGSGQYNDVGWQELVWAGVSASDGDGGGEEGRDASEQAGREWPGEKLFVDDIACTFSASFFVGFDAQRVYVCGSGSKGELGLGPDVTSVYVPAVVFDLGQEERESSDTRIVSISACMNHVVVLSSSGRIFGWGASRKGQLGESLVKEKIVWKPQRLLFNKHLPIKQVVTGREFAFVLGNNLEEQYFLGDAEKCGMEAPMSLVGVDKGQDIDGEDAELKIFAGWSSIIVKKGNHIQGFGRNTRGQILDPSSLPSDVQFKHFGVGSEHSIAAIAEDGVDKVISWGWGEHGNCGLPCDESGNVKDGYNTIFVGTAATDSSQDQQMPREVLGVAAGCATSFFWSKEFDSSGSAD